MRVLFIVLIVLLPVVFAVVDVVPEVLVFDVSVGGQGVERLFVQGVGGVQEVEFLLSSELRSFVHVVRRSSSVFDVVVLVPEGVGEGVISGELVVITTLGGLSGEVVERVVPVEIVVGGVVSPTGFVIGGVEEPVVPLSLNMLPLVGIFLVLVFLGNVVLRKKV